MCGIAGVLVRGGAAREELRSGAEVMSASLVHRGPDDAGTFVDETAGLAFGFRRLAILDLTEAGHQPMTSPGGRYVGMLNGEVYNAIRLREELAQTDWPHSWRGRSDTEVALACIEQWGIEAAVQRYIGMFALAVWDRRERTLHLVRDRLGVKPLYYGLRGRTLLFASELKALVVHPAFGGEVDRHALGLYARFGYVPAPYSIYRGIQKQLPGTIVTFREGSAEPRATKYWSLDEAAARGLADRFVGSEEEAGDELERLLDDSMRLRLIADVPVGVFLSGGIDSSIVAALAQTQSTTPIKTFSIGFEEPAYDESLHAATVARHLGTQHTTLRVSAADALAAVPLLPHIYDEPFGDSSQIPTYLVSKLARGHVTVALSGDGGDELFGGYRRYFLGGLLASGMMRTPRAVRRLASSAFRTIPASSWNRLFDPERRHVPLRFRSERAGERLHQVATALSQGPDALHSHLVSQWTDLVLLPSGDAVTFEDDAGVRVDSPALPDAIEGMMLRDQHTYLPDDILVKVDRASMAVSLEAREPLLDHRLVELAWRLPVSMKVRRGQGKRILRRLLARHLPSALISRPKRGFALPLGGWLRGPLRDWAEALLDPGRLKTEGFFDAAKLRQKWDDHIAGRHQWQHHLWTALMFQAWLQERRQP